MPGGRLDFGQEITARVAYVRADGRLNLSMRQQKEHAMVADAEDILNFLKKRGGKMPYCDDTPMEIIKEKFGISKAAFKRAWVVFCVRADSSGRRLDDSAGKS